MIKCKDCKHWNGIVNRSDQEPRDMLYGYCDMLFLSFEPYARVQVLHAKCHKAQDQLSQEMFPRLCTCFAFGCIGACKQDDVIDC